jgi:hypothetical protein
MQTARKHDYYERILNDVPKQPQRQKEQTAVSRPAFRVTPQMVVCIACIFIALSLILVRYAELSELKVKIFTMKDNVKALEVTRDELAAQRDQNVSLESVEKIARENLAMQYPTDAQTIYIEVPQRYTLKKNVDPANVSEPDWLRKLSALFHSAPPTAVAAGN